MEYIALMVLVVLVYFARYQYYKLTNFGSQQKIIGHAIAETIVIFVLLNIFYFGTIQ